MAFNQLALFVICNDVNMKKIFSLLFIFIALIVVTPVQSQSFKRRYGVKGGMGFTTIAHPVNKFSEKSTGFFIGPMAELYLPIKGMGVNCALMYFERDYSNIKEQGLEIPVNLKYVLKLNIPIDVYGEVGATYYVNYNAKKTDVILDFDDYHYTAINDAETQKRQIDFNLGAGIVLFDHLQMGISYQIPAKKCYIQNLGEQYSISADISSVNLVVSYLF